jgi:hypothetical protein
MSRTYRRTQTVSTLHFDGCLRLLLQVDRSFVVLLSSFIQCISKLCLFLQTILWHLVVVMVELTDC